MTEPMGPSLGRVFTGYDDRSRDYRVRTVLPPGPRRPTFWPLPSGPFPLNQGAEGACTGFGMAHELAAGPIVVPGVDAAYALHRYRRNQQVDRAAGHDFPEGATVLSTMKAAKVDGLLTGYRWCFGVDDVVDTVCRVGPVCLGIEWRDAMYATAPDGLVTISGPVRGGHFLDVVGYDIHPNPAVGECVLWLNSWGRGYGVADSRLNATGGIGWLRVPDLAELLAADGEAVVPADYLPLPPPPPPPPPPAPTPPPTSWWDWLRVWWSR